MITHRLNYILKKCKRSKFRNGYIKYLESLDYEEFKYLLSYYMQTITRLVIKYNSKNIKLFSRNWFKYYFLKRKYYKLFNIFFTSNAVYLLNVDKEIDEYTKKKISILTEIVDIQNSIKNINQIKVIINSKEGNINFLILLVESIFFQEKLEKLHDELNKLNIKK